MAWKATRRERIMVFGGPKVGKSFLYIGLMDFAIKTKTDSHFWVIDNDNATEGIGLYVGGTYEHLLGEQLSEEPGKREYERATIWVPESFDDYPAINKEIRGNVKAEDWIIPDMLSNVWEIMPDWWIQKVYGDDPWDYYAAVRKDIEDDVDGAKQKDFGGQAGVDWQYIGKAYRAWEKQITMHAPCHVLALASETEIQERYDRSGEKRAQYKSTSGFAPKTEKGAPHRFHTYARLVRRVGRDGKSTSARELTVVGDRDRMGKWEERGGRGLTIPISEGPRFAYDYLMKIGGWKPAGG